jgi:two-component sensor histidine kinase
MQRLPVKKLLNSGILRQNPVSGTIVFAVLYFGLSAFLDWLFGWRVAEGPMPPLWTVLLSLGAATLISSVAVYLLLSFNRRQQLALEELNHSLRNSLQVLMYAAQQCDADTAPKAQEAIDSISDTLRDVTQRLGAMSEREYRPNAK